MKSGRRQVPATDVDGVVSELTAQSRQVRMGFDTFDELCRPRVDVLKGTAPKPLELLLADLDEAS